jgi:hypothetical protein
MPFRFENINKVTDILKQAAFEKEARALAAEDRMYKQRANELNYQKGLEELNQLQRGMGSSIPNAVSEYNYFKSLSKPEQDAYLLVKRNPSQFNLGGQIGVGYNPYTGGFNNVYNKTAAPRVTIDAAGNPVMLGGVGGQDGGNQYIDRQTDAALNDLSQTVAQDSMMGRQQNNAPALPSMPVQGNMGQAPVNQGMAQQQSKQNQISLPKPLGRGMYEYNGQQMTDKQAMAAYKADLAQQNQIKTFREKEQIKVAQDLPNLLTTAGSSLETIDKLLNNPALNAITGNPYSISKVKQGGLPFDKQIAGSPAADARVILSQIKGKAFLEAFNNLKGGGAITEIEGQKATDAIAALSTAQSPEAMRQSLNELKAIVQKGIQNIYLRAGQQPPQQSQVPINNMPAGGGSQRVRYNPNTGDFE